jgi:CRP-like cAMP-binding protein
MSIKGIFPINKWDFESESVFKDLPLEDLELLLAHRSELSYKKGEMIFREGANPSGIFYIRKGKAKKFKSDRDGREQIIYVANPGEILGYHAVLSADNYPDSAAVLEESILLFIPKGDFLKALDQSSVLSRRLLKTLSHEFAVLTNQLAISSQRSVRERLALQLIIIREKYKDGFEPGDPVEINMSRDDLASLVGTARENVVRILSEFKSEGAVETRGRRIIVRDINKLIKISNYL